jgi:hypothetical protein
MPWTYNQQAIRVGRGWTNNDGIKHPYNWNNWSAETKAAQGLVWEDEPASFDSRFYWAADLPKALDNVDAVDEDGNPMLDEDGVQIVTLGLKSYAISAAKSQAAGLLSATDWYVVRKAETDAAIPEAVLTYRAAVRTASGTIENFITSAANFEAFMALYNAPMDADSLPIGNAPINDWPTLL